MTNTTTAQQGLDWLNSKQSDLIEKLAQELGSVNIPIGFPMPIELRRQIATNTVNNLITRVSGVTLDSNENKNRFVATLNNNVGLQDMLKVSEKMSQVLKAEADRDLADKPVVRDALVAKIQYVTQLVHSFMGAAVVELEGEKVKSQELGQLANNHIPKADK